MKYFAWIIISVVAIAVIAGFFIVGSPREERLRRFDEQRAQDLQTIQWEIINYWRLKTKLPQSLDMLKDDIRGFAPPVDPESGMPYEYMVKQKNGEKDAPVFELCAAFNRASDSDGSSAPKHAYPYGGQDNWEHGEGRACFERIIDKDLYPPIPKQ